MAHFGGALRAVAWHGAFPLFCCAIPHPTHRSRELTGLVRRAGRVGTRSSLDSIETRDIKQRKPANVLLNGQ